MIHVEPLSFPERNSFYFTAWLLLFLSISTHFASIAAYSSPDKSALRCARGGILWQKARALCATLVGGNGDSNHEEHQKICEDWLKWVERIVEYFLQWREFWADYARWTWIAAAVFCRNSLWCIATWLHLWQDCSPMEITCAVPRSPPSVSVAPAGVASYFRFTESTPLSICYFQQGKKGNTFVLIHQRQHNLRRKTWRIIQIHNWRPARLELQSLCF